MGPMTPASDLAANHSSSLCCDSLSDGDSSPGFGESCWSCRGCFWRKSTSSGLNSILTRSSACTLSCNGRPSPQRRLAASPHPLSCCFQREQWQSATGPLGPPPSQQAYVLQPHTGGWDRVRGVSKDSTSCLPWCHPAPSPM